MSALLASRVVEKSGQYSLQAEMVARSIAFAELTEQIGEASTEQRAHTIHPLEVAAMDGSEIFVR